jgi:hypothetical protein
VVAALVFRVTNQPCFLSYRYCHRAHAQDNHVDAAGGIPQAVGRVREHLRAQNALGAIKIEVQCRAFLNTTQPNVLGLVYSDTSYNRRLITLYSLRVLPFSLMRESSSVAQLEVRTLAEVRTALTLAGDLDRIMLDNMVKVDAATGAVDTSMLRAALALINGAFWCTVRFIAVPVQHSWHSIFIPVQL